MKKFIRALIITIGMCAVPAIAQATVCSQAHTFVTGETLTNVILNANPANFVSCFSAIDHNNIGTGGIYASQIVPTNTAQATFGGQFGYVFGPGVTSQVPLTIFGVTSQTADLFDVTLTSGGTVGFGVSAGGFPYSGLGPATGAAVGDLTLAGSATAGNLYFGNSGTIGNTSAISGAGNTITLRPVRGSSAGLASITSTLATFSGTSGLQVSPTINATNTAAFVPPTYKINGTTQASTAHIVWDQVTASGASTTVTFSGAAVFSSASAYMATVYDVSSNSFITSGMAFGSGSAFSFPSTNTHVYNIFAIGF